jgi:hypothetical protein
MHFLGIDQEKSPTQNTFELFLLMKLLNLYAVFRK